MEILIKLCTEVSNGTAALKYCEVHSVYNLFRSIVRVITGIEMKAQILQSFRQMHTSTQKNMHLIIFHKLNSFAQGCV